MGSTATRRMQRAITEAMEALDVEMETPTIWQVGALGKVDIAYCPPAMLKSQLAKQWERKAEEDYARRTWGRELEQKEEVIWAP